MERRKSGSNTWETVDNNIVDNSSKVITYTVTGLACEATYEFRLRAYGDGNTYARTWGTGSDTSTTLSSCPDDSTPTPTPPTVKISEVFPGTESVAVVLEWSPKRPDSLSEVKVSWDKTSGLKCRIPGVSCPGSATFTNPSFKTVFHVQRKDGGGDAFDKDSDYTKFEVKAKGRHLKHSFDIKGSFQDDNGKDKSVTTSLPTPELNVLSIGGYATSTHPRLPDVQWKVFKYVTVKLGFDDSIASDEKYKHYRVDMEAPPGTGLQVKVNDTESCNYGSTNVTTRSGWEELDDELYLVRCSLGDGNTDLTFKAGLSYGGKVYAFGEYARIENVKQSVHQKDDLLTFHVRGTYSENNKKQIRPIKKNGLPGLFSSPSESGQPLPPDLLEWSTYSAAGAAWDEVGADVDVGSVDSASPADIVIQAYWDPGPGGGDLCQGVSTCIRNGSEMLIENPPRIGSNEMRWTSSFYVWSEDEEGKYRYLPAVLVHEFGHPVGFSNSNKAGSILAGGALEPCRAAKLKGQKDFETCEKDSLESMSKSLRWLITDTDKAGLKAIYGERSTP